MNKTDERGIYARKKILNFITEYMQKKGWSPTIREIAEGVYSDKTTVHYHLGKLEDQGKIVYEGARQIRVL